MDLMTNITTPLTNIIAQCVKSAINNVYYEYPVHVLRTVIINEMTLDAENNLLVESTVKSIIGSLNEYIKELSLHHNVI